MRKCDCCEDKKGGGRGNRLRLHPRNCCVFYHRTLDLEINKWKNKHCPGIWRQAQYGHTHTYTYTMSQWGALGMVVTLSNNPIGWKLLFSVLSQYFYTCSRSQNTSRLFSAVLVSKAKGDEAELPVNESFLYQLVLCFCGMCVKIPWGAWLCSKVSFYLSHYWHAKHY